MRTIKLGPRCLKHGTGSGMAATQDTTSVKSSTFGADLLASVVVFLVALPLCMGIAIASNMPIAAGLITGIIGGIVVGSIAGSPLQVSGPAAGLAVLVWQLVEKFGIPLVGVIVFYAALFNYLRAHLSSVNGFALYRPLSSTACSPVSDF